MLSFLIYLTGVFCLSTGAVPSIKMNNGINIPVIGLGTWQATGTEVYNAVKDAIDIGYRHIDTAQVYQNEKEVGQAINEKIKAGVIKREDIYITTKVMPDNTGAAHARTSVNNSLTLLNVSYVDLVLIHFPFGDYVGSYLALEEMQSKGLTKSIGISNFGQKEIENLMKTAKVKPAMNQIVSHPRQSNRATIDYSIKNDIQVTAYSPLGSGDQNLLTDATIAAIGAKHNKTVAQVLIRWQIQRGVVVIPKSVHKERIKEDFEVFDFTLTADEMKTLEDMK